MKRITIENHVPYMSHKYKRRVARYVLRRCKAMRSKYAGHSDMLYGYEHNQKFKRLMRASLIIGVVVRRAWYYTKYRKLTWRQYMNMRLYDLKAKTADKAYLEDRRKMARLIARYIGAKKQPVYNVDYDFSKVKV